MSETTAPATTTTRTLTTGDLWAGFGAFLRLHVADGDASPHTIRSYHTNAAQFVQLGKGSKARTIYLTETTTEAVRQWLAVRAGAANEGERALFVSLDRRTRGSEMTARAIRYVVDGYLERLGLSLRAKTGTSCHSLRHSAATRARAGGAKIDALADMLGHASADTTRIYSKIVDRMTENPARYLEAMRAP